MADYTEEGIVTKPVVLTDVGLLMGRDIKDLGTLCKAEEINMWAKYKPMHYFADGADMAPVAMLSAAQMKLAKYGISLENPTMGISGYIASVDAGTDVSRWQYKTHGEETATAFVGRPYGTKYSLFRLADFWRYNHNAEAKFGVTTSDQVVTVDVMGDRATLHFACYLQTGDDSDTYNIGVEDVLPTDGNYYYTVRVLNPNGVQVGDYSCEDACVTEDGEFNADACAIDATIVSASGTWTVYHMLMKEGGECCVPFPNYNKTTFSFQSKPITVISKAGMAYADIVTQWSVVDGLKYYDMEEQINIYGKSSIVIYAKVTAQKSVTAFKPTNLRLQADANTLPYSDVIIYDSEGETLDSVDLVSGREYVFYFAFQGAITNYEVANECDMEIALSDDENAIGYISTEQVHFTPSKTVSIEGTEITRG